MKKILRFIILVGVALGGAYIGYAFFFSGNSDSDSTSQNTETLEYTVQKKDFESSIALEGTTEMTYEQELEFNTTEEVIAVNVAVGDTVKEGQILAKIDTSSADSSIESRRISLENTVDKLNEFIDDSKNVNLKNTNLNIQEKQAEIEKAQYDIDYTINKNARDLEQAQLDLETAKNDLEILKEETTKNIASLERSGQTKDQVIEEKELALEKLRDSLEDFQDTFDTKLTQKINEYYTSVESNFVDLGSQVNDLSDEIESVQKILGYKEPAIYYAAYFSTENLANRASALEYLKESIDLFETFEKEYNSINMERILKAVRSEKDVTDLIETVDAAIDFYNSWYQTTNAISKGFQDSKESDSLSQENILSYTQQYVAKATDAQTKITELTNLIEDLRTTDSSQSIKDDLTRELEELEQSVTAAELEIQEIKDNQNYIVDTSGSNISNAQIALNKKISEIKQQEIDIESLQQSQKESLEKDKVSLGKLQVELTELQKQRQEYINLTLNSDYKLLQNNVEEAQVNYDEALENLEDYVLTAPFDGVVTKVEMQVGDRLTSNSSSSDSKYIALMDPDAVEVSVSIGQSDITRVEKGMNAEVTLNAYPNRIFSGSISEIDTIPTEDNGTTTFAASVLLEKPDDVDLYSGLTADVTLIAYRITDAIVVPFTSVTTGEDSKKYVTVITNGNKEQREITTGFTDGSFYEVTSGLEVGEVILEIDYDNAGSTNMGTGSEDGGMGMPGGMMMGGGNGGPPSGGGPGR